MQVTPTPNIAIFVDFENIAIGVRNGRYGDFDADLVLERLLDKGKIVVKKAYADWTRYKSARRPLHEAAFELIEIPHVSYSGKNSADIRLVVDALDLCYTKDHIDVFVVISGDSDFSPLVSKLRENAKKVIAMGVKNSTSDLLVDNCDEFIYYDDLVREKPAGSPKKPRRKGGGRPADPRDEGGEEPREPAPRGRSEEPRPGSGGRASGAAEAAAAAEAAEVAEVAEAAEAAEPEGPPKTVEERKLEALEMVLDTADRLFRERDDNLWGSMVKQTLKRKRPNFSETFHGYRNFNELLEDARDRGMLEIQKDERSGGYVIVGFGPHA